MARTRQNDIGHIYGVVNSAADNTSMHAPILVQGFTHDFPLAATHEDHLEHGTLADQ